MHRFVSYRISDALVKRILRADIVGMSAIGKYMNTKMGQCAQSISLCIVSVHNISLQKIGVNMYSAQRAFVRWQFSNCLSHDEMRRR